jgi:hypothetical protein
MFGIDATPLDPELLDFTGKTSSGKSGGRGLIYSQERGRYIKPMLPRGKVSHFSYITDGSLIVIVFFYVQYGNVYCISGACVCIDTVAAHC